MGFHARVWERARGTVILYHYKTPPFFRVINYYHEEKNITLESEKEQRA